MGTAPAPCKQALLSLQQAFSCKGIRVSVLSHDQKKPAGRVQEKQKLSERQIEELLGRVSALELEKQELQRALEAAKHAHEVHRQVSPSPLTPLCYS